MSLLPHDTFVNPSRALWAVAGSGGGGGGGNTLTSPASVVPDSGGNTLLSLTATGTGDTEIDMTAVGANAGASVSIESQQGIASLGLVGGSAFGSVINMTGIIPGGKTTVIKQSGAAPYLFTMAAAPAQVGQSAFLAYDSSAGTLALGDSLPTGAVVTNQPLRVQSAPSNGNAVVIASESSSLGSISNTVTGANIAGTLTLNPREGNPVLTVFDNGGGGTNTTFADNGEGAIIIQGGIPAAGPGNPQLNPRIYASLLGAPATPITLNLGTNTNQNILQLSDTPNANATITGDIVITGTAVVGGSITANNIVLTALPSSSIQVPGQGGAGQPPVGITMSVSQTLIGNPELSQGISGSYNGGLVGQARFNFGINSAGSPAGVIGNLGAQVLFPAALGDIAYEGLWLISLVVSNASTDIYSKLAQINTISYWNPTTGFFGGSGGASPLGGAEFRSGINPSNVIAAGQLWVTNSSGNNWTGMSVNATQLTGVVPGFFVA